MKHLFVSCILGLGLALALLAFLGASLSIHAYPIAIARYVVTDGDDVGDCATIAMRCRTIQYAVDVASSLDQIWVAGGTYTGTGGATVFITKSITLLGGWDGALVGARHSRLSRRSRR